MDQKKMNRKLSFTQRKGQNHIVGRWKSMEKYRTVHALVIFSAIFLAVLR